MTGSPPHARPRLAGGDPDARAPGGASIVEVGPDDWPGVEKSIFAIERESFPPSIRERNETLRREALSPSSVVLAARPRGEDGVVGYLLADKLEKYARVPGVKADPAFGRGDTLYITSVAVDPAWRGRGLGGALHRRALAWARRHGFKRAAAHLRQGAAGKLRVDHRVLDTFKDWYGTGETYDYVVFEL